MADFSPVFLAFPQMAKGNSQMGRENSEDRRYNAVLTNKQKEGGGDDAIAGGAKKRDS